MKHRREVIGQVRKWSNEPMEAHATAAHAYLRKADVGSYVFAGEDNDGKVIDFDPNVSVNKEKPANGQKSGGETSKRC